MRIRYWQLIGKEVRDVAGQRVGHIADLVAERQGDALCVTALRVGSRALVRRIVSRHMAQTLPTHATHPIPWRFVASINSCVRLSISAEDLRGVADARNEEGAG